MFYKNNLAAGAFSRVYDITSQDRVYTALPLYHSAGGMIGVGMMIYTGATLVLRRKFSASQFISDIIENDCTVFQVFFFFFFFFFLFFF